MHGKAVRQRGEGGGHELRVQAAGKKSHAAHRRLVHGHHRHDHYAGNEIEADRRDPGSAERGIADEVAPLGAVRVAGSPGQLVGYVRPEQAVRREQQPHPERRVRFP